jgi:outer membrane immunogenic protein
MRKKSRAIKRAALAVVAVVGLMSMTAIAQEFRSEISAVGTGFFTKDANGNGIRDNATDTGGFLVGYRYNFTRWLSAEANYGYDRNTQRYFGSTTGRVQTNIHTVTGSAVVKLPTVAKLQPYVLGGGGALVFDPTDKSGGGFVGATWQAKGAFAYGGGADYAISKHFSARAEYRGYVYKAPDFSLTSLKTDAWTHVAAPSAGVVYHF